MLSRPAPLLLAGRAAAKVAHRRRTAYVEGAWRHPRVHLVRRAVTALHARGPAAPDPALTRDPYEVT
ncbi:hypothetical protein ABZ137_24680 [Streptomyces bobili]|uniref:hypothetical protein n=1 Tax=Streptomyces bobili TaxID=67280 RepID=UPI0033A99EE9